MRDIEENHKSIAAIIYPSTYGNQSRRSQRQRISPSPEPPLINGIHSTSPNDPVNIRISSIVPPVSESKMINSPIDSTSLNPNESSIIITNNAVDQEVKLSESSTSTTLMNGKKNVSTTDLDPLERKKQAALNKVQAKLEKAQRLYQAAQLSVEQNISEFLRVTTLPGLLNDSNSSKTTNAAFDKRIRTLQDTKKELEKKIANYQSDLVRIQSGDIPNQYASSKDILNNIKSKVSSSNNKNRSSNDISGSSTQEITTNVTINQQENDQTLSSSSGITRSSNSQQNSSNNHNVEPARSSPSNSISNEIGNSQFYINLTHDHIYDNDKINRKHEEDFSSFSYDLDKSPVPKRRLTEDSNIDVNDHNSDHSSDDRYASLNASKRSTMTIQDHHQLLTKIDSMQKTIERYETKINDLQKSLDSSNSNADTQREQIERLNNELTDLTDLHQIEMSTMKSDLKKLEDKLLYNIQEYCTEMIEKLEKLDTRTTKVEQTQTHSLETEENTHRVITKLVNIVLTVFAIILLLLSTIKNLVQSRFHAFIILILILFWIASNYFPDNPVADFVLTTLEKRFNFKADPSD